MYQVGPWFVYIINLAVLAFVALGIMIWVLRKRNQHAQEAHGKILAEVWLPTGRAIPILAAPLPDGWVNLGKLGDYKLAGEKRICTCGHEESFHNIAEDKKRGQLIRTECNNANCACQNFQVDKLVPAIRRWSKYPTNPFLGLKTLQVDVRTEAWYLNDPEPITPSENRMFVTAVDAQFHTREAAAELAAVEIQEHEARQRELQKAINNQPNKVIVYVGIAAVVVLQILGLTGNLGG